MGEIGADKGRVFFRDRRGEGEREIFLFPQLMAKASEALPPLTAHHCL